MPELKPCSTCEAEAKVLCTLFPNDLGYNYYEPVCKNGHSLGKYRTKEKAEENWNSRPREDELQARIEELEKLLEIERRNSQNKSEF